jgi:hypothetical protein
MGKLRKKEKTKRTLVISMDNGEDYFFLESLLKKLGIKSKLLTDEEREDIGLAMMMKEVDPTKTVSYEKVMKKLRGK